MLRLKSYPLGGLNDSISFIMMLKPQDKVSVGLVSALSSLLLVDESLFLYLYTVFLLLGSTFSLLIRSLITLD